MEKWLCRRRVRKVCWSLRSRSLIPTQRCRQSAGRAGRVVAVPAGLGDREVLGMGHRERRQADSRPKVDRVPAVRGLGLVLVPADLAVRAAQVDEGLAVRRRSL